MCGPICIKIKNHRRFKRNTSSSLKLGGRTEGKCRIPSPTIYIEYKDEWLARGEVWWHPLLGYADFIVNRNHFIVVSNFGVFSQKLCWLNKFTLILILKRVLLLPYLLDGNIICILPLLLARYPHPPAPQPLTHSLSLVTLFYRSNTVIFPHNTYNSIFHYISWLLKAFVESLTR